MPAILMHIALATIVFECTLLHVDKKDFILGTTFPDIRYLKVIEREKTHIKSVSWDQILQERNSFKCGFLVHSFIDQLFDDFMSKNSVYENLPKSPFVSLSFKLFADKIIYKQLEQQLAGINEYFDSMVPEELSFGIKKEDIDKWHNFIKKYCSMQSQSDPFLITKACFMLPDKTKDAISSDISQMNESNSLAKKFALNFYDFAVKKIKEQKKS